MKRLIFGILLMSCGLCFSQNTDESGIAKEIDSLKKLYSEQQKSIDKLYDELNKEYRTYRKIKREFKKNIFNQQELVIDSLDAVIKKNSLRMSGKLNTLTNQINETKKETNTRMSQLDNNLEKNRLYWIIATLVTLLLGGLIYWLLGKRISSSKTDVETQIRNTKASLEEESVKLDNKLIEVLEKQLQLKQETSNSQSIAPNEKPDHSLALKVADEIVRIQKNLGRMEKDTRGLNQLNQAVIRIKDNFTEKEYEIVDMLGKEYNEGMKLLADFIPSEDIETGKEIITRIIKPQVNFKGKMIQAAQVEVSIGE
ncbi:hypothetical protein OAK67_01505 [Crocinitomicaceae bacterium]|nr:hypothetical protein [Crocinitomicaceae bacterium]